MLPGAFTDSYFVVVQNIVLALIILIFTFRDPSTFTSFHPHILHSPKRSPLLSFTLRMIQIRHRTASDEGDRSMYVAPTYTKKKKKKKHFLECTIGR